MTERTLQYLVADAESWERTAGVWEEAYNELSERYRRSLLEHKSRLESLRADFDTERLQWKKVARRERTSPGIGFFGGYGVGGWTVGFGLVWRVM